MKRMWKSTLAVAAVMSTLAFSANALPQYTVMNLGEGFGSAINATGQVAGYAQGSAVAPYNNQAFFTGANGVGVTYISTPSDVNGSFAVGINATGQITGSYSSSTTSPAFVTGPNGVGITELGGLRASNLYDLPIITIAKGINANGQVVGGSVADDNVFHAFITGANGVGISELGIVANGGANYSFANGVNDNGQVVGEFLTGTNNHAFITGTNGIGITDLGTLDGDLISSALGINASGQVIGRSITNGSDGASTRGFITGANGVGMRDIGSLGGGTFASGINTSGQVVGSSFLSGNTISHAFITGNDGVGITDLNTLLAVSLSDGGYLVSAATINDIGQIVAMDNKNQVHLLTISPVPLPATVWLFGSGLLGLMSAGRRKIQSCVRSSWFKRTEVE